MSRGGYGNDSSDSNHPPQELDNFSAKSLGHLSSFSEGAIYTTLKDHPSSEDQPGSLGALRTHHDVANNF